MSQGTAPARKADVNPDEWKMRVELAAAFRLAAMQGWDELLFAHISARVPGEPNQFLMHRRHPVRGGDGVEPPQARREQQPRRTRPTRCPHKFALPFHKGIYDAFPQAQVRRPPAHQGCDRGGHAGTGSHPRQPVRHVARPDRLSQLRRAGVDAGRRRAARQEFRQEPGRDPEGPRPGAVGPQRSPKPTCWPSCQSAPARCRSPRWRAASSPTCRRRHVLDITVPQARIITDGNAPFNRDDLEDAAPKARPRRARIQELTALPPETRAMKIVTEPTAMLSARLPKARFRSIIDRSTGMRSTSAIRCLTCSRRRAGAGAPTRSARSRTSSSST